MPARFIIAVIVWNATLGPALSAPGPAPVAPAMQWPRPQAVQLGGVLGQAAEASRNGRLRTLPDWDHGQLFEIYSKAAVAQETQGTNWIGEHAGKWMITAARAADRTGDTALRERLGERARYLIRMQEPDGYLGTYAPSARFTSEQRRDFGRSWDLWNHSYTLLGLLEIHRYAPDEHALHAATRIGDLLYEVFYQRGKSVAYQGNHDGLSATVVLEPIVELYKATADRKYLDLAERIIEQIEARPGLEILSRSLRGDDLLKIGDGKIYQLCWTYVGLAKLYEVTGQPRYLKAVEHAWTNIVEHHLTLGGGPWGGIATHRECFNAAGFWSPYGFVEACSVMSWIHLNRELLALTGQAKYADEIDRSLYNALLGAHYPNGEDWCYFTFPNGRRHHATYRDCCRSSGALTLEEIAPLVYGSAAGRLIVNLFVPGQGQVTLGGLGTVGIRQETEYPRHGKVTLVLSRPEPAEFTVALRIPGWARDSRVAINGTAVPEMPIAGTYMTLARRWHDGDSITLTMPMRLTFHRRTTVEQHRGQDMLRIDWLAVTRGPLVYATDGLIDGREREEVLRLPEGDPSQWFGPASPRPGCDGPALSLNLPGRDPVAFLPYFEAGGRADPTWRMTWIQTDLK